MILDIETVVPDAFVCIPMSTISLSIDWGDGTTTNHSTTSAACPFNVQGVSHNYTTVASYTIKMYPWLGSGPWLVTFGNPTISVWGEQETQFLVTNVQSFGSLGIQSLKSAFAGSSVRSVASQLPSTVTNIDFMFNLCPNINSSAISSWTFPLVTSLEGVFSYTTAFNQPLSTWNVGNIRNFKSMFAGALNFNRTLASWNTSSASNMFSMFQGASVFNQPINTWDVSSVTDMSNMFSDARAFNQSLSSWNMAKVRAIAAMFANARAFNQPLGGWNTSAVTTMRSAFALI
jgi:surface protein